MEFMSWFCAIGAVILGIWEAVANMPSNQKEKEEDELRRRLLEKLREEDGKR